jgi:hypothetical protein
MVMVEPDSSMNTNLDGGQPFFEANPEFCDALFVALRGFNRLFFRVNPSSASARPTVDVPTRLPMATSRSSASAR